MLSVSFRNSKQGLKRCWRILIRPLCRNGIYPVGTAIFERERALEKDAEGIVGAPRCIARIFTTRSSARLTYI